MVLEHEDSRAARRFRVNFFSARALGLYTVGVAPRSVDKQYVSGLPWLLILDETGFAGEHYADTAGWIQAFSPALWPTCD